MIKIERKTTVKSEKAIESLEKAKQSNASYNTSEVNAALQEMFHKKCYICENNNITSYQIEHLIPHKGDMTLKYDWNNLFLSCAHCNNTKLGKYDPILDCTKEAVDEKIRFRKEGFFGRQEEFVFEALDSNEETQNTVNLLRDVYYGTTPQKIMEAKNLRKNLRKDLANFKEYVREYEEAEDEDKEDLRCLIKEELGEKSSFVAFKRWLIRDNRESFPELAIGL